MQPESTRVPLVRHEGETPRERSTCGWRDLLISRQDADVAAWVHAVDIDGARLHYHKRATELYYVLDGAGDVLLDGVAHAVRKGSVVHIPPGVVHGARGRMRVLVVGIPDIAEDDLFLAEGVAQAEALSNSEADSSSSSASPAASRPTSASAPTKAAKH